MGRLIGSMAAALLRACIHAPPPTNQVVHVIFHKRVKARPEQVIQRHN
jgi:hypothetical protein